MHALRRQRKMWVLPMVCGLAFSAFSAQERPVVVSPRESQELLANPGMGWQTFQRFANEDKNLAGLSSSSAYFRFYWREIEPGDGAIDFAKFDDLLSRAHRAGQKLAFRVMCTGSGLYMDVPAWLKDQGCRGFDFKYEGRDHWVPDFEDPLFKEKHFRLIRELGRRYDGHPDLDLIDIGSVGLWGEWHMSGTESAETGRPVPLPSPETRLAIINAWREAFPSQPKVILIGSEEGMLGAVAMRYGWRADCLGDMGGFSKTWNHMDNFYLQQIGKTKTEDAWRQAPVAFESCWDMRKWKTSGWDIRYIYDYALKCHASYMNNKSAPIPEGTRDEVERFLRRLGYRLVLRSLEYAPALEAGTTTTLRMRWENVGVAPPYWDYRVAVCLKSPTESAKPLNASGQSIRGWLPGENQMQMELAIPRETSAGEYELAVGVVDPRTGDPAVRVAIEGRDQSGWYPLSTLKIVR